MLNGIRANQGNSADGLQWRLILTVAILVTLHNLDMAVRYADYMMFMKNGGVFAFGKSEEILDESLLEKVYDIPMKIIPYNGRKFIVK